MVRTRQEALAQINAQLAELRQPMRPQNQPVRSHPQHSMPMVGCIAFFLGIGSFLAGSSVLLAVSVGLKRPLRELGIRTPTETGALFMTCGAFVVWISSRSGQKVARQAMEGKAPAKLAPPNDDHHGA